MIDTTSTADLTEEEIKRLEAYARTLPSWDDLVADMYRESPSLATQVLEDEIEEYEETGDIRYVLSTLKHIAQAKGFVALERETGLTRQAIYAVLNGKVSPRLDTMNKLLKAFGLGLYVRPLPKEKKEREKIYA